MLRLESVSTRWGLASLASGWEDIRMTIIDNNDKPISIDKEVPKPQTLSIGRTGK